jgi:hypothetical protein
VGPRLARAENDETTSAEQDRIRHGVALARSDDLSAFGMSIVAKLSLSGPLRCYRIRACIFSVPAPVAPFRCRNLCRFPTNSIGLAWRCRRKCCAG